MSTETWFRNAAGAARMKKAEDDMEMRAQTPLGKAAYAGGDSNRVQPAMDAEITQILLADRHDEADDFRRVVSLTYDELRKIAKAQLRRLRPGATLDTGGLIHETYLKLARQGSTPWQNRSHFFAVAARAMRQILVDYARKKCTPKHGAKAQHIHLDSLQVGISSQADSLLALDEALTRLAALDPRLIQIVECRFYAGYSERETAEVLDVSVRTVQRQWKRAKAWLKEEIDR